MWLDTFLIMQSMSPATCDIEPSNRHVIISRSCGLREGGAWRGAVLLAVQGLAVCWLLRKSKAVGQAPSLGEMG